MNIRLIIIILALLALITASMGGYFSTKEPGFLILLPCLFIVLISLILNRIASREFAIRKTVEEEFRSISHRFQAIINASPLPITIVDAEGKLSLWNLAADQVFGWAGQEVIGKYLPIIPAARHDEFMDLLRSIFRGNSFKAVETQRMRKDGTLIDVALSAAPVHNAEGVITSAMCIYEDITERRKTEEERLKGHLLESIGILAGGIAHDFNNLLSVILGNIAVAKMCTQPGDKAFSRLDDAENVCEMAAELSKRLITFATGGDPVKKPAPLTHLLRNAVAAALKDTAVDVKFHLPDDLSLVAIDEGQIKQVFVNLFINAREAMPAGGTLTVRGENIHISAQDTFPMREGNYVKISIKDTGSGIPADSLAKIFDPYYSTKDTYSQKGLGLGLAVCYSIIKKHDGLITAESQVGEGTTFTIYLNAVKNG